MTEQIEKELLELKDSLQKLSKQASLIRDSFTETYLKLDFAIKKLGVCRKKYEECYQSFKKISRGSKDEQMKQIETSFEETSNMIQTLKQKLVPSTGSLFVRFLLGRVNVKVYKDGERIRLKSEYEKFKCRTNPLIIFAGLIQYFFPNYPIFHAAFQLWLAYYYITLALREHILKVNGSNINAWWIAHHYIAILLSAIVLTWDCDTPAYTLVYPQLMLFCIAQGVVQILMNRYQIGRLYNAVACGKASKMDVTADIIDQRLVPSMSTLSLFLIIVQTFQFFNSYSLLSFYYFHGDQCDWHEPTIGLLFLVLAFGNMWTIVGTIIRKRIASYKIIQTVLKKTN